MRRCCVVVRRGFANFDVCGDKTGTLQAAPPSRLRGREGRGLAFQNWAGVSKLGWRFKTGLAFQNWAGVSKLG
jgi:hypothetical protein